MAAPSYVSDLTDIFTDGSTTGWSAIGGGASGLNQETDYFIQGTSCISKNAFASDTKGMIYNAGATTIASGDAVYCWVTHHTPGSLDLEANGGLQVLIGSGSAAYNHYYVKGSDTIFYGAPWVCGVIDPTTATPSTTTGSPTATTSYFGVLATLVGGPTKGSPLGVDGIRHGRALSCTDGDGANGYATFVGAAEYNDYNDVTNGYHRYGQFQKIDGGYLMQCLFEMGTTATAVDFRDSNRSILVNDTKFVGSGFNAFEVNNASSNVDLSNITITALGTTSRGNFSVNDNATVSMDSCTFTDMGTFGFLSNTTATSCTFRRTDTITVGGGTLTGCTISNSRSTTATVVSSLSELDDCTFISDGTGHAVDLGTISSTTSMNWNCSDSGYAATNGSTGNETILVNVAAGQTLTINVAAGATTPTYYNTGTGTVSVVSGQVTLTLTGLVTNSEVRIYTAGTTTELDGVENSGTTFGYTYTYSPSTFVDIVVHNVNYKYVRISNFELGPGDASLPIQQIFDRNYDNP